MGICTSAEQKAEKLRNEDIENQLKKEEAAARSEVKMLLLGAGESGKSTIIKQMKLIHDGGYNNDERESFKEIIYSNTIQSMRVIMEAMVRLNIPLGSPANEVHQKLLLDTPGQVEGDQFPKDAALAIKELWIDSGVQTAFLRSNEYQLNDSAKYYFDAIDRISVPGFSPSDQDVLRSRVKTTGICETTMKIDQLTYRIFDVGGQRSERKKWIHCFENVTAIVFMVAISEYDQKLVEDEAVNRMTEALTLFDSICNSRWFLKTSFILFLNKIDIFKDKIIRSPIAQSFPEFTGGTDFDQACEFFLGKFNSLNQSESKQVYCHFTCATDTDQIKFVMAAVNDIIVQNNLRDCGLM